MTTAPDIRLRGFSVSGDWSPLLKSIGWYGTDNHYSNGVSFIHIAHPRELSELHFQTHDHQAWDHINEYAFRCSNQQGTPELISLQTPTGAKVNVIRAPPALEERKIAYTANHAAISAKNYDKECDWWSAFFGRIPTLKVTQEHDPLEQVPLDATHYYFPRNYYLTIRDETRSSGHIGFEAETLHDAHQAIDILKKIKWDVKFADYIDGSYVVHFKGPDGRIHDFFYTEPHLKKTMQRSP